MYGDTPDLGAVESLVGEVFAGDGDFDVSEYELSSAHDIRVSVVRTLLTYLELLGHLERGTPFYATYQFRPLKTFGRNPGAVRGRAAGVPGRPVPPVAAGQDLVPARRGPGRPGDRRTAGPRGPGPRLPGRTAIVGVESRRRAAPLQTPPPARRSGRLVAVAARAGLAARAARACPARAGDRLGRAGRLPGGGLGRPFRRFGAPALRPLFVVPAGPPPQPAAAASRAANRPRAMVAGPLGPPRDRRNAGQSAVLCPLPLRRLVALAGPGQAPKSSAFRRPCARAFSGRLGAGGWQFKDKGGRMKAPAQCRPHTPCGLLKTHPQTAWISGAVIVPVAAGLSGPKAQPFVQPRATPWGTGRSSVSLVGPTGQPFAGRTVGPLGRCTRRRAIRSPGRCPGLGELMPLRGDRDGTPRGPNRGRGVARRARGFLAAHTACAVYITAPLPVG